MEINDIKEDLQRFENLIKMINFDYTQFFAGNIKHPPLVHEREANALIKKYNMHQITNTTLRFKFNNLVARYLTFREKWKRKMMEFEGIKKPSINKTSFSNTSNSKKPSMKISYQNELNKLPEQYNKEKIKQVIENKILEYENKGYKNIDVKIDIVNGKPKLKIKPV
jgi:hypothetical protein